MPLAAPNLDDRTFLDLVEEARRRIRQSCPEWTDLSEGDPGMVLVEVFAHLTELMLYRLNRLPEKAYVELLRLMDVRRHPPVAAAVTLRFGVARAPATPIEIPRGSRVGLARPASGTATPVFVTTQAARIEAGETAVDVPAQHGELVEGELAGVGTGLPGQTVRAERPPIVAAGRDEPNLVVGVEGPPPAPAERAPALTYAGKTFHIWREVESFAERADHRRVYVVDRSTGTITFAPAVRPAGEDGAVGAAPEALGEVPAAGCEIRLWYARGGGLEGNVQAGTLTVLKDPIRGVDVTNPSAASGGRGIEPLDDALRRGPQELHSLRRAVTARDFELIALRTGAVARARAVTRAALWRHAVPGTVEVLLVPYFRTESERGGGTVTAEALGAVESEEARRRIQGALDERRPLGTTCVVSWVRYKTVRVSARVVVHRGEDPLAVRARVLERLHLAVNPLPTPVSAGGWRFGQPIRASQVFDIVLSEPGVQYVDRVRLLVDEVPDGPVRALAGDPNQPRTWYAASRERLFRSLNDGEGWEPAGAFPGEVVRQVRPHAVRPGLLAVATESDDVPGSRIFLSADCGESWQPAATTAFRVQDLAWTLRDGAALLLLATDKGLYELGTRPGATPVQVLVDPGDPDRGFYALTVAEDVRGATAVALAAHGEAGVFLSREAGRAGTFAPSGLHGEDVRVLAVQIEGPRTFLWAGVAAPGNETGKGAFRLELGVSAEGWRPVSTGWSGGSCRALVFRGATVFAATHRAGVLRLDSSQAEPAWEAPAIGCGLPVRDVERLFHPVDAVATSPSSALLLAGGARGVFRSADGGTTYTAASNREFAESVTLPDTWLFCSGAHEIDVVSDGEAR